MDIFRDYRTEQSSGLSELQLCAQDIVSWMTENKLTCKSIKTQVVLLLSFVDKEISKLQCIQNAATHVITKTLKMEYITPILCKLHWLPVHKRIAFKILVTIYNVLNGLTPRNFADLLVLHQLNRHLCSNTTDNLQLCGPVLRIQNIFILCTHALE